MSYFEYNILSQWETISKFYNLANSRYVNKGWQHIASFIEYVVVIKSHIDVADQKVRVNHFFTAPKTEEERELERQLCQDKGAGEWFRLEGGEKKCRDVIQCTASVSC